MRWSNSSGSSGSSDSILNLVCAIIGVGILVSLVTGDWIHWIPIIGAIIVGLKAVRIINR